MTTPTSAWTAPSAARSDWSTTHDGAGSRPEEGGSTAWGSSRSSTRVGGKTLEQVLRRPPTTWDDLVASAPPCFKLSDDPSAVEQVTIEAKYGMATSIARPSRSSGLVGPRTSSLPVDLDYLGISQLRAEAREKFARVRPRSLGQAGRISGINPADIATLLVHLKRPRPTASVCPDGE